MPDNPERVAVIDDMDAVTIDDITAVVRDGLGFAAQTLSDTVVVTDLLSSSDLSVEDRSDLYHKLHDYKLHDPDLSGEQIQQIIFLHIMMGRIVNSAHTRVEFDRDFMNQTFQPTLFQEVA